MKQQIAEFIGEIIEVEDGWAIAKVPGTKKKVFLHRANLVQLQLVNRDLRRRPVPNPQRPRVGQQVVIFKAVANGHKRLKALAWCSWEHQKTMVKAAKKAAKTLDKKDAEAAEKAARAKAARQASMKPGKKQKQRKVKAA